jgi:hypothetical protein
VSALASFAQAPHDDWRTITTEHYRIHYPAEYEQWTRHAAGKLEAVRALVAPSIGYEPREITDVIVADPLAVPNGSAWPFLGSPRMVLWASPPGPGSMLAHQSDWAEIVAIHEDAHLVHLLRPTRNPFRALGWYLLPVRIGPVTGAPRWAVEGYATVIEGQLTGKGRPHGDMRASILRRWAQEGRMPTYERLASDSSMWMGQSMAYLVGSAYLEWLLEREGAESLQAVWARLTARQSRTFEKAFEGVYGDSPSRLYQRFTAELTQRAMTVESSLASSVREGAVWQDLAWFTDLPDLSHDEELLVTVRRPRKGPAMLTVHSTLPDTETEEKWQERIDEMLSRDPEDVAPVRRKPPAREPKYRLARKSGAVPQTPRWIADTGSVLFVEPVPDRDGFMHPDLFRWNPKTDEVWRLTVEADLRDADPIAKGAGAVAVRNRFGASQLVHVDFASREIVPLTPPSIVEVYGNPRVSPDEALLAYVVQRGGEWWLVVRDLGSGEESSRVFDGTVAHPEWSHDGTKIYASVGADGFVEIWELEVRGGSIGPSRQLTRSSIALFGPAAGRDEIYFLAMDADGIDLRRLELTSVETDLPPLTLPSKLAPAVRLVPETVRAPLASQPLGAGRPYGFGRQEISPLIGGSWAASGSTLEAGTRIGDPVGRTEVLAIASLSGGGGVSGGFLSGVSRKWPVEVSLMAFSVDERPSRQSFDDAFTPAVGDRDRIGVEGGASKTFHWRASTLLIGGGTYWSSFDRGEPGDVSQWGIFGRTLYEAKPTSGRWEVPQSASLDVASGSTDDESFTRVVGRFSFGVTRKGTGIEIEAARGEVGDDAHPLDRFEAGGLRTSLHAGSGAFGNRVWAPGLPHGSLGGSSFTRLRGTLLLSFVPVEVFYERIETSVAVSSHSIDHAGLAFEMDVDAMPLVKIPQVTIAAGVAIAFDEPVEDEVSGWIGLRWSP